MFSLFYKQFIYFCILKCMFKVTSAVFRKLPLLGNNCFDGSKKSWWPFFCLINFSQSLSPYYFYYYNVNIPFRPGFLQIQSHRLHSVYLLRGFQVQNGITWLRGWLRSFRLYYYLCENNWNFLAELLPKQNAYKYKGLLEKTE